MADNTIFDSVFKTLLNKNPELLVPLINEAFGRNYPQDSQVSRLGTDHQSQLGERVADLVFCLEGRLYHVECQSTSDTAMVARMIEYDFAIALEQTFAAGLPYEMYFPSSCVLFLRHTKNTPDELTIKVHLPDGDSFDYKTKVVKAKTYTSDAIFEKQLLLLLPFYLMRYEHNFKKIAADDARMTQLLSECADLRERLEQATLAKGNGLLYDDLIDVIIRINNHLLRKQPDLQKKARGVMGGEILELWSDRLERETREAHEQGIEQGMSNMGEALTAELLKSGVDETLIAKAKAAILAESKTS